jgi:hypothetical protein
MKYVPWFFNTLLIVADGYFKNNVLKGGYSQTMLLFVLLF